MDEGREKGERSIKGISEGVEDEGCIALLAFFCEMGESFGLGDGEQPSASGQACAE